MNLTTPSPPAVSPEPAQEEAVASPTKKQRPPLVAEQVLVLASAKPSHQDLAQREAMLQLPVADEVVGEWEWGRRNCGEMFGL